MKVKDRSQLMIKCRKGRTHLGSCSDRQQNSQNERAAGLSFVGCRVGKIRDLLQQFCAGLSWSWLLLLPVPRSLSVPSVTAASPEHETVPVARYIVS